MTAAVSRILLVEDEDNLARNIAFNLEQDGHEVTIAGTLAAARTAYRHTSVELIVLDRKLPDGSGLDLLQEVRRANDPTPVLVLTARSATSEVVAGLRSGADDYMGKPFALDEFLLRVAALLRRTHRAERSSPPSRSAAFGGNQVDLETGRARTVHGTCELTGTELRLLRYFVAHRGEDLSRQELLTAVWDLPAAGRGRSRTLDTFMLRLRQRFERNPRHPEHFRTAHGVGYRFHPGAGAAFTA